MTLCLAATCHDPAGGFAAGVGGATALWDHLDAVAVNVTEETDARVVDALRRAVPVALVARHPAGSVGIGAARRDALALALETGCTHVAYSDLDHVLRWAQVDAPELRRTLRSADDADLIVVGRSEAAFAREPARLRLTEGAVNAAASLAVGLPDPADFMMAVRVMTRAVAVALVEGCAEETIGVDVAWPLFAQASGFRVAARAADGLAYRHRDDFGSAADERDADATEWLRRIRIAGVHAEAMRPYVEP
jgi:hypothetical protein